MSGGVGHLLQIVQMFGCGADTDCHSSLETRACQSWEMRENKYKTYNNTL